MARLIKASYGKHIKVRMPLWKRCHAGQPPTRIDCSPVADSGVDEGHAERRQWERVRPCKPYPSPPGDSHDAHDQTQNQHSGVQTSNPPPTETVSSCIDDQVRQKYRHKPLPATPDPISSLSSRFNTTEPRADPSHRVLETFDSSLRNAKRLEDLLLDLHDDHVTEIYPRMANQLEFAMLITDKLSVNFHFLRTEYEALERSLKEGMEEYVGLRERAEGLWRENQALRQRVGEDLEVQNVMLRRVVEKDERRREDEGVVDYEKPRGVGLIGREGLDLGVHHKWRRKNKFVWERRESVSDEQEPRSRERLLMQCRFMAFRAKRIGRDVMNAGRDDVKRRKDKVSTWWAEKVCWCELEGGFF